MVNHVSGMRLLLPVVLAIAIVAAVGCRTVSGETECDFLQKEERQIARYAKKIKNILNRVFEQAVLKPDEGDAIVGDMWLIQTSYLQEILPYYLISRKISEDVLINPVCDSDRVRFSIQFFSDIEPPELTDIDLYYALLEYGEKTHKDKWPERSISTPEFSATLVIEPTWALERVIHYCRSEYENIVDAIEKGLSSKSPYMRAECLFILVDFAPMKVVIPAIWKSLKDQDAKVRLGAICRAWEYLPPLEKKVMAVFLGFDENAEVLRGMDEMTGVICSDEYAFDIEDTNTDEEILKKAREWYRKWEEVKWYFVYEDTGSGDRKLVFSEKARKAGTKLDPETGNILSAREVQKYEKKEKEVIDFLISLKKDKK